MNRHRAKYLSLYLGLCAAIAAAPAWGQDGPAAPCSDPLAAESAVTASLALDQGEIAALRQFYAVRANACAWSGAQIETLRAVLAQAGDQGLEKARYRPEGLAPASPRVSGARDFYASAAALRYAHDMVFGRVDLATSESEIAVPRPADDTAHQLEQALTQPSIGPWLASLPPADPAYRRLAEAYRRLRDRPAAATLEIEATPPLKQGESSARVALLKDRLRALGDLHGDESGPDFDATTKDALIAFQRRNGLTDDGKLTKQTVAALNVPDAERLDQIAINLDRWRYFGHVLAATRIEVNTAAATVQFFENNRLVLAMRAVVGGPRHQSPTLISPALDAIVLNPTWHVPDSIISKEIEPILVREPDYLERHNMHWDDGRLQQSPGSGNALGRIKFDFPSPFAVYLHDTPSHSFFARANRALSHGCIRLEHPADLALKLLASQDTWSPERLKKAVDGGWTQKIDVPAGPQVALVYWTAFVDEDGTLEFREDQYRRDANLEKAIAHLTVPAAAPRMVGSLE